jgi:hypothetical protein
MINRISRQLQYTAAVLLFQSPALAQDAPKPKSSEPKLVVVVSAAVCGAPQLSIAGKPGALVLIGADGRVLKTGTDLAIVNAWLKGCPKEGKQ